MSTGSAFGSGHTGNPIGRFAADHPGMVKFGKAGWAAKGIVYVIAGVLALIVAAEAGGWKDGGTDGATTPGAQEASPQGAIETIAGSGGGVVLLWLLAIGMVLYALWRVITALLPSGDNDAKTWAKKVGYLVSAILYASLAITAVRLAQNRSSSSDGNSKVSDLTARVMESGGGRVLIGVVGVIVIAVGLYRLGKGVKQDVADELDMSGMSTQRARWTRRLGAIGEVGRGIALGLIGFFLVRAAMTYDANEATGLDGALRRLATDTWGLVVVALVGIGFVAYGIFCLATFTRRRLEAA